MTGEEIKRALTDGRAVTLDHPIYGKQAYKRISGVIYRKKPVGDGIAVSVELEDLNGGSVTIAEAQYVH